MLAKAHVIGYAANEPDIKNFNSGAKCATVRVANNRKGKDNAKITDWWEVKVWGKTADVVEQYLKKGHKFYAEGDLEKEYWTKDGRDCEKTIINARTFKLLESKGASSDTNSSAPKNNDQAELDAIFAEDEIPF